MSIATRLLSTRVTFGLDATVSAANGLVYLAAAELIDGPLGVPATLLRGVGAFFLVYAADVWFVATRQSLRRPLAWAVVAANLGWVALSLVVAAAGWFSPTTTGTAWIVVQAAAVAALAGLQARSLAAMQPRRPRAESAVAAALE